MSGLQPLKLPKSIAELAAKGAEADLQRIEDLLNALQNLKVEISEAGTTRTVNATVQFSGNSAVLVLDL